MKYKIKFTKRFKKDLKQARKQGKDIEKLFDVIEKIARDETLDEKYRDHSLAGNYKEIKFIPIAQPMEIRQKI
ncbi:type II toxin-antitoxin system YafQ family toxin [Finegoldia magna]|uniref:type II toxin-antitoxin system YafQ family toxin n=1 Tax=Finegoldia magna TaxID=1260 RepID=UPI0029081B23|nr:type II toxin-antitoxin system YafQ family toxin [Finegoldia magna]MDU4731724.1 type II toxin-antitoxin system YafQ family toxin [Finegoldia magna]